MKQPTDRSFTIVPEPASTERNELIKGSTLDRRLQELTKLADLLALWREKCVDGALPSWKDFDVFELRPWIGHLNVVDVTASPFDFRYRIFGSDLSAMIGEELTGRHYEDLKGQLAADIADSYRAIITDPQPALITHSQPAWYGRDVTFDRLLLPMQATDPDGSRIVMVGAYVTHHDKDNQDAAAPRETS